MFTKNAGLTVIAFYISLSSLFAQTDTTAIKKPVLTIASIFKSNIDYYGQVTEQKLPYVLVNANYKLPFGLYFSGGGYKLFGVDDAISEIDFGIGYSYQIGEKLGLGLAYTRSFFPENSPVLQASNPNNINFSTTYHFKPFDVSADADYAFGKESDYFTSATVAKNIELGSLFGDNFYWGINPSLVTTAGTTKFVNTYLVTQGKNNNGKGSGSNKNVTTIEVNEINTKFKMLSYSFKLPVNFYSGNYLAELSYQFSILNPLANTNITKQQSFFGVAFYYQF